MLHRFYRVNFSLTDDEIIKLNELIDPLGVKVNEINNLLGTDEIFIEFYFKQTITMFSLYTTIVNKERKDESDILLKDELHNNYDSSSYVNHIKSLTKMALDIRGFKGYNALYTEDINRIYSAITSEVNFMVRLLNCITDLYDETYMFTGKYIYDRISLISI